MDKPRTLEAVLRVALRDVDDIEDAATAAATAAGLSAAHNEVVLRATLSAVQRWLYSIEQYLREGGFIETILRGVREDFVWEVSEASSEASEAS